MTAIEIKKGVILSGLDIRMRPALIAADIIWKQHKKKLCITCGLDGAHSAGSMHYYALAIDCRSRYFKKKGEAQLVARELREELGSSFDVVVHSSHIHIEYKLM